jgi:hypothetical protein
MKFTVTFKTPDAIHDALADLRRDATEVASPMDEDTLDAFLQDASKLMGEFIEHGEYVDIEFDTHEKTAKVLRR